jgi:pimeloyl-ACP methyl ester carboxylesterase
VAYRDEEDLIAIPQPFDGTMAAVAGERFEIQVGRVTLVGERWDGEGTPVVLLHAGVADRRSWYEVAERLAAPVIAYDRRGFGETPASPERFTHLDDLLALLGATVDGPAWLVGNSMGGALALDAALVAPERVAGLVLIAPAVNGQPEPEELDADSMAIVRPLQVAGQAGDIDEQLRLHAWLWLDGPAGPEGRIAGQARELALAMNDRIVRSGVPEDAGEGDVNAWARLEEVSVPTTLVWGDRDVPFGIETCHAVAARVPRARTEVLRGTAHLPSLEQPAELAAVIQAGTSGR